MTIIRCEAFWCKFNTLYDADKMYPRGTGECLNQEIELNYDEYEQFWCKSNKQEENVK